MAVDLNKFSNEIFNVLKGHGLVLELFTDDGERTTDPEKARRFYSKDQKIMINIDLHEKSTELKVNVGTDTDIEAIKPMLNTLRKLANTNLIEYTLRTFGKSIEPKDFAYQAKKAREMKVEESFSKLHGSRKSSYQQLEDVKLIVRHKKNVDEEVRGSRSRNIHSLFIETAEGERFKFPNTNINAARAMTQHVRHGGTMYDELGTHIVEMSKEFSDLQKFSKYAKKNSLVSEDTAEILDSVKSRLEAIRKTFKQLSGTKGYNKFTASFDNSVNEVDETTVDNVKDMFTVRSFDETVASALPHVARIVNEISSKNGRQERLQTLLQKVTTNPDFTLSKTLDSNDPDHPANVQFATNVARVAYTAGYLGQFLRDDDLANKLGQLSDDIHDMDPKQQQLAAKIVKFIVTKSNVAEATSESIDATEEFVKEIETVVESYSFESLFIK